MGQRGDVAMKQACTRRDEGAMGAAGMTCNRTLVIACNGSDRGSLCGPASLVDRDDDFAAGRPAAKDAKTEAERRA